MPRVVIPLEMQKQLSVQDTPVSRYGFTYVPLNPALAEDIRVALEEETELAVEHKNAAWDGFLIGPRDEDRDDDSDVDEDEWIIDEAQRSVQIKLVPISELTKELGPGEWRRQSTVESTRPGDAKLVYKMLKRSIKNYNQAARRALVGWEAPALPRASSSSSSAAPELPNPPRQLSEEDISNIMSFLHGKRLKPEELKSEALKEKVGTKRTGQGRKKRTRRTRRRAGKK